MSFDEEELYTDITEKAAALAISLLRNHPFVDGNKRTAHAAMAVFLLLNGWEIEATVEEQEQLVLELAAGKQERDDLVHWLSEHTVERGSIE
jgi:death-on-curing protein